MVVLFVPLIISSGGNSGNQSATLVITGLRTDDIRLGDWAKVMRREVILGLMLGIFLAFCGLVSAWMVSEEARAPKAMWVLPVTIVSVVLMGSLVGSLLPLIFERLGLDPALMSNPFVAGIVDILGIVLYMNVAWLLLT